MTKLELAADYARLIRQAAGYIEIHNLWDNAEERQVLINLINILDEMLNDNSEERHEYGNY